MPELHVFRANKVKRIRRMCPYCKRLCYGDRHDYYDGSYFFLDCGTKIDCDGWTPPPKKKCPYCRKYFEPLDMIKHLEEYHQIKSLAACLLAIRETGSS